MTLQSAQRLLQEGKKITHTSFTKDEYIYIKYGKLTFEDGVIVPHDWFQGKSQLNIGWSEFKEIENQ